MAASTSGRPSIESTSTSTSTTFYNVAPDLSALEKSQTAVSGLNSGIPFWRRCIVVFVLSWVTLGATFSSTSLLSVGTEISEDLHTTPEAVNFSSGGLLLAMGLSSFVWSPLAAVSLPEKIVRSVD
jgi:hypothetical protein